MIHVQVQLSFLGDKQLMWGNQFWDDYSIGEWFGVIGFYL